MQAWLQVLVVDTNQPQGLEGMVSAVTSHVGPPHNYSGFEPAAVDSQPADVSPPAAALEAADMAVEHAAAPQEEQLTAAQVSLRPKLIAAALALFGTCDGGTWLEAGGQGRDYTGAC